MAEEPGKPWRIYLEDAVGGSLTPLIEDAQNQSDPNWSADGETLVFGQAPQTMTTEHETAGIYEVDLAGHHITEIPGSTGLFSPRLSHDGRYIVAIDITSRCLMLFDRQIPA